MTTTQRSTDSLPPLPLPEGVTSNYVSLPMIGLNMHYLSAGYLPDHKKPLILLLHGYPELGFSWRKIMPTLADAGYHVVAPDQRGFGRTAGWDDRSFHEVELLSFSMTNLARDIVVFVAALGHKRVECVVGHDFGAVSASMSVIIRPDIFKSLVLMSHPWKAIPALPFGTAHQSAGEREDAPGAFFKGVDLTDDLAKLDPPRKHYKWYHSSPTAASDMLRAPQGLKAFLRGYIHTKSADYSRNQPGPLKAWTAEEVAKMPGYYIMPLHKTMPETIAEMMETEDAKATIRWLPDEVLDVYLQEWSRTGIQGGLNWYRVPTADTLLFSWKKIEVPTVFVSGKQDWGNFQQPGALEGMGEVCSNFHGTKWVEGAGHWPQQEQPAKVAEEILAFVREL